MSPCTRALFVEEDFAQPECGKEKRGFGKIFSGKDCRQHPAAAAGEKKWSCGRSSATPASANGVARAIRRAVQQRRRRHRRPQRPYDGSRPSHWPCQPVRLHRRCQLQDICQDSCTKRCASHRHTGGASTDSSTFLQVVACATTSTCHQPACSSTHASSASPACIDWQSRGAQRR